MSIIIQTLVNYLIALLHKSIKNIFPSFTIQAPKGPPALVLKLSSAKSLATFIKLFIFSSKTPNKNRGKASEQQKHENKANHNHHETPSADMPIRVFGSIFVHLVIPPMAKRFITHKFKILVECTRLKLVTSSLPAKRSNQLS